MPGPSSSHSRTTKSPSSARAETHPPAPRRVLERVVDEVGEGLPQPRPVPGDGEARRRVEAECDPPVLGHVLVELDGLAEQLPGVESLARQGHRPVLRLRDVHERGERRGDAVGLLQGRAGRAAEGLGVGGVARALQHRAQAREGRAQVVGDVVERPGEPGDQGLDAVEHLVEEPAQVVEGVPVPSHRHPLRDLARAHDRPERRGQAPQRSEGPAGECHSLPRRPGPAWRERRERRPRGTGPGCRRGPRCSCRPGRACRPGGGPTPPRIPPAGPAGG